MRQWIVSPLKPFFDTHVPDVVWAFHQYSGRWKIHIRTKINTVFWDKPVYCTALLSTTLCPFLCNPLAYTAFLSQFTTPTHPCSLLCLYSPPSPKKPTQGFRTFILLFHRNLHSSPHGPRPSLFSCLMSLSLNFARTQTALHLHTLSSSPLFFLVHPNFVLTSG